MKQFAPEENRKTKKLQYLDKILVQEIRPVPIFCNQWGVKHLVPENLGRRQYVRDLANLFEVGIIYESKEGQIRIEHCRLLHICHTF